MIRPFAPHEAVRHLAKLIVDQLEKAILGLATTRLSLQKLIQNPADL
jgi:hypothetical protein